MKKYIMILILAVITISIQAQDEKRERGDRIRKEKNERMESRIEAKKIGFITEELDLTTEEAQRFWPIYNEFQKKIKSQREETRQKGRADKTFTDAEAEVFLNTIFDKEQNHLDLKREYYKKMEGAITKAKLAKLYIIENKFREKVYRSIKRKMKGRGDR
jgi:Spy/CpxP family protein refolding chaperone